MLLLLDEHLSTDDIAKRLFISEHTVRSHVKSMLRKLGVSSRRDALEQLARRPALTRGRSPTAGDADRHERWVMRTRRRESTMHVTYAISFRGTAVRHVAETAGASRPFLRLRTA